MITRKIKLFHTVVQSVAVLFFLFLEDGIYFAAYTTSYFDYYAKC